MVINDGEDERMEEEGNGHPPEIEITADNSGVAVLTSLLRAINFCEKVNVFITMNGMRFVVEEGKYVQAEVQLMTNVFKTYIVRVDGLGFKMPIKELLDCMKILGADGKLGSVMSDDITDGTVTGGGRAAVADACLRSLHITYRGYGTPFCFALVESKMYTEIELKTEEHDVLMEFEELDKQWEIVMDAKLLQEFLVDLEGYAPEHVVLRVVPDKRMELRANGEAGSLKITIPNNCIGIEKFCAVKETHQANYKFSILKHSFKLIQVADKVLLKMLEGDVLNLQIVFNEGVKADGNFYAMPTLVDLDDDFTDVDH